MKKRLVSILSVIACLCFTFAFPAVSRASSVQGYEYTAEDFAGYMNQWMQMWLSGNAEELEAFNQQYESYGMPVSYDFDEEEYGKQIEKIGGFKEYSEAALTQDGNVITVTQNAVCENGTVDFTFSLDMSTNGITWTADVESTPAETFIKACMNTVMGMGTVFIVLIFISYVISLFMVFSKAGKKKKSAAPEEGTREAVVAEPAAVAAEPGDDELVAVISAAVAAYEAEKGGEYEVPADGLFVRSIKKR